MMTTTTTITMMTTMTFVVDHSLGTLWFARGRMCDKKVAAERCKSGVELEDDDVELDCKSEERFSFRFVRKVSFLFCEFCDLAKFEELQCKSGGY